MVAYKDDTDLLDGILSMKDSGEAGCDLCGEVYPSASAPIVEVYDDAGWVSDSVDEMSGDHFAWWLSGPGGVMLISDPTSCDSRKRPTSAVGTK